MIYTLLALPFFLYIVAFSYVPIFGWALAFTNYKPGKLLSQTQWIGLKNFKLIAFYWKDVSNALKNTLIFTGIYLLTGLLPIIFAILLNEIRSTKTKKFIQTASTLPNFVGWVIVYSLAYALFSSYGMIDTVLMRMGLVQEPTMVLAKAEYAKTFQVLMSIWKSLGWNSIIYIAAIVGIDQELYEAAAVDGAGRFMRVIHITLPGILPTYLVLLLLGIGNLLKLGYEQYYIFSNSVTKRTLEVIDVFTYRIGIQSQDYTFATAISVLNSVISLGLLTFANTVAKKIRGDGII